MEFRYELINFLINRFNLSNYLEIGYQNGICFGNVIAKNKKAVDPRPLRTEPSVILNTSDEFFSQNKEKFDIIFIDGLHTYEQVKRDFDNSVLFLNDGGVIVLHDMNPSSEDRAKSFNDGGEWNGDCFKIAIDFYNGEYDFEYHTLDIDQGCMFIFPSKKTKKVYRNINRDYLSFDPIRKEILNLITNDELQDLLNPYVI